MAGRRPLGLSLWNPGADWLVPDGSEPALRGYRRRCGWLVLVISGRPSPGRSQHFLTPTPGR